jgi:hydroxymethylbilane synthase
MKLRAATRGSPLAMWQTHHIASLLKEHGFEVEPVIVQTGGDKDQKSPLHEIGGQGIFVKEIQSCVIEGQADFAVHSLKDLPSDLPSALTLASVPDRGDPRDALVGSMLKDLKPRARVATGSIRRKSQLAAIRPDISFYELRGNIHTRLEKAKDFDAIIVAATAIERLGLNPEVIELFEPNVMIPQVGQGAIGLECLRSNLDVAHALQKIEIASIRSLVDIERSFLKEIGADCSHPVGAHASIEENQIRIRSFLCDNETGKNFRDDRIGSDSQTLGKLAAKELLHRLEKQ